ncbi:zinc finger protein 830-like [Hibiscus syriacus]|uniref:zinc finger protein 830-like n=1 Tax=Hibiscus syriacus TaxID=106335 RepID=UPI00192427FC|nr:zinc finger protein 830-like [Hibiscus syriacus]XP_039066708.1 zinc finger protein 830-like [Hibiscus syriacus]
MDAQGRTRQCFAPIECTKKEKRIDNPLIKYNESDQPVCRVCEVVLKSVSHWDAHQASRKHHEAINTLKANAARLTQASNTQSGLHQGFFDNHEAGKQKTEIAKKTDPNSNKKLGISAQTHAKESPYPETEEDGSPQNIAIQTKVTQIPDSRQVTQLETKKVKGSLPDDFFDKDDAKLPLEPPRENKQASEQGNALETKQVKGALPEGFFDNKEADLRARGIKPVKIDVKDEYKEFEKLIQEDLQVVDNRMEEEEIDAAETIEEAESLEQKVYKQKVEMLWKRKLELESTRSNKRCKGKEADRQESDSEDSSSDGDSDENFAVDWRAQHL